MVTIKFSPYEVLNFSREDFNHYLSHKCDERNLYKVLVSLQASTQNSPPAFELLVLFSYQWYDIKKNYYLHSVHLLFAKDSRLINYEFYNPF